MPRFNVLITDYAWPDLEIERGILREIDAELIVAPDGRAETLMALAADADAIMTNWAKVSEHVIAAAPKCRIVARLGIGLDNIDVAYATQRGIAVTNVPDYCLQEVAEHALALLLSLGRKVAFYHHATKSGCYDLQAGPPLRRIAGQTLGIVGLGHIGRRFAKMVVNLKLRVVAFDVNAQNAPSGVRFAAFDDVLRESDYVSLHVPLVPQTRGLIGGRELGLMKPSAYLINTARGGLIDHRALAEALANHRLAGAALDVQEVEPPNLDQPPYNDPRVIVTPHASFASVESLQNLRTRVARQVATLLTGGVPEYVVNAPVH
jgi:D-3-phosphoglycerate dehydrogenase